MPNQSRAKNKAHHKTKGQRKDEMARKRDERVRSPAYKEVKHKKAPIDSYLADDENFDSFKSQLSKLGLHLRDIPGDGNCLFRALGDQLEGHGRNHYRHRLDVVSYMLEHRGDFEPFVEDDIPFDRHVAVLKKLGTYAGNDAIVAFAKRNGVNVVIHQLNSPIWTIQGVKDPENARELHISYHNGDHYSSVRRIGDNLEAPANIKIKASDLKAMANAHHSSKNGAAQQYHPPQYSHSTYTAQQYSPVNYSGSYTKEEDYTGYNSDYDNVPSGSLINGSADGGVRVVRDPDDIEDEVERLTGCTDRMLIQQTLVDEAYDVDRTVQVIFHLMINSQTSRQSSSSPKETSSTGYATNAGLWSDTGTGTRIFGTAGSNGAAVDSTYSAEAQGAKPKSKMTSKEKRLEKKKRQEQRHQQNLRANDNDSGSNYNEIDVSREFGMLKI